MMNAILVKDIFSKEVSTVNEQDSLSKCLELFKKQKPPVVAVLDEKGKYVGMIARRWIVRARLDPATTKVKSLMRGAPKIGPETTLSKAAKLMIESGSRQLPVFEKDKLIGFVTDEDVIHGAVMLQWGKNKIETIMTKGPHTLEANRSVGAVLSLFREQDISHVPVTEKGKLIGIISTQDLIEYIFQPNQRQKLGDIKGEKIEILGIPAKGIMTSPVITVSPDTSLKAAEKKMHEHNIHCLVVVDNEVLVGIVTKLDFLEPISQLEDIDRRLTIQFSVKGIEIDPITRGYILDEFDSFAKKYRNLLESGTLFVYMKTHGSNQKGQPLVHCRLQLRTVKIVKGFFVSSGEGWGIEPTFRVALDRLDKRILRSKELQFDTIFQREYLKKVGFPEFEL